MCTLTAIPVILEAQGCLLSLVPLFSCLIHPKLLLMWSLQSSLIFLLTVRRESLMLSVLNKKNKQTTEYVQQVHNANFS